MHAAHVRSVRGGGTSSPNVRSEHTVSNAHTRSDVGVGATLVYSPSTHCVMLEHSLLLDVVGASNSYSISGTYDA